MIKNDRYLRALKGEDLRPATGLDDASGRKVFARVYEVERKVRLFYPLPNARIGCRNYGTTHPAIWNGCGYFVF